jgi:hypothetical protein
MNNAQQQDTQHRKRPYQKPAFTQVPLRPEEAVLGHCKTSAAAGPGNRRCSTLNCRGLGS